MSGDADNTNIWEGADVYRAPVGTTAPVDVSTPFGAGWDPLGLLSADDGLTEARDEDRSDHYAWGGLLVRTVRSKHKRTFQVTLLEDTAITFGLLNPGSTQSTTTGVTTRVVKKPTSDPQAFAFETVDGTTISRKLIPKGEITEVGEAVRKEDDLTAVTITVTVYPASDGTLYREITNAPGAAVA
jgi:hypothetical protein